MASVHSLASTVQQRLADALSAALPEAGSADPLLRRSDRADFQANGILALAKKLKGNPRELATQVVDALPTRMTLIKDDRGLRPRLPEHHARPTGRSPRPSPRAPPTTGSACR